MRKQRGGTLLGIVIGMVLGLGAALAVAVYVTKVPIPFLNKSAGRSAEHDAAEARKNRDWEPNAPLYGKNPMRPSTGSQPAASSAEVAVARPVGSAPARAAAPKASAPAADPLGDLAAARSAPSGPDPFLYYVQAGAFRTAEDAESQRARLSLMGVEAKVIEREQSGRPVFRVRVGPFEKKDDADKQKEKLDGGGVETALVRVQR